MTESPPRYRLKAPQPSESDLQGQILDYLRAQQARGRVVWYARINGGGGLFSGGTARGKGRRWVSFYRLFLGHFDGSKGMSDIVGQLAGGQFFALEAKKPGEKPTPEQRAYLEAVRQGGGRAAVVTSWEEARVELERAITPDCL